jgi:glycine/serine hydroxymethyltransferase
MTETEMVEIADIIASVIKKSEDAEALISLSGRVQSLCDRFPIY